MRKREIAALLTVVMLFTGCSGYYEAGSVQETVESAAPVQQSRALEIGEAAGPDGGVPGTGDTVIESLQLPDTQEDTAMNPEIFIATDIHYLAKELTDFGEAFEQKSETGDGKVVPYVWEIVDTFLDAVVERKPQVLILSGDLTLDGEYLSHQALARKLIRAEKAGVEVVVIPGNHDINNPEAAAFEGENVMPAEQTTPEEFAEIYADFGYDEAVVRDPASLSYIYELPDGTWLLMLDSCQYEEGDLVGGMIRPETYDWIEQWMEEAHFNGRSVIAVAHHNLLDESRIYEEDCTIEHGEQLEQILADWDVSLFLSGHLHVQHYRKSQFFDLNEIVTGSLAMAPCQYGVLKYFNRDLYDYHTEKLNVRAWAERHANPDTNLRDFDNYAAEYLRRVFYDQAYYAAGALEGVEEEERDTMADFYSYLNAYAVAGRAVEIKEEAMEAPGYIEWQEWERTNTMAMYINEILEDAVCDYNVFSRDGE